jgi:predicted esterase
MTDILEDLIQETEITLRDAFRRGFEQGGKTNNAILDNRKDMLRKFVSFKTKFIEFENEGGHFYALRTHNVESAITLDQLIKTFLLTYENGED